MRWVLVLILLSSLGCQASNPELEMKVDRLQVDLETAQDENRRFGNKIESLEDEVRRLNEENQALTARLEKGAASAGDDGWIDLMRENADLKTELARYRDGLKRAENNLREQDAKHSLDQYASELNAREVRREQARERRRSAQARSGKAPSNANTECCVHTYDPYVSHVGTELVVSGNFENARSTGIRGDIVVEIFDGREKLFSDSAFFRVPSKQRESYEFTFTVPLAPKSGGLQARVRWEDGP